MSPSSRAPLNADEMDVWSALATLLERLPAALDAQLQHDSGLTHFEHGILYALDAAPERTLRLSVLAGYANSTLSRLSRAVTRLEAKGWIRREVDAEDGRFTLGILTGAGHRKVEESTPAHQALIRRVVFDTLTPAQARQLGAASRKISAALSPDPTWAPGAKA
ncbi:MarR family transcriptional regulator [Microbacterium paraoxydans]|uniref:MarR family winged helix-turn-helix transcriptional regulator n=1 Tax=Microbacterium TaxID=33882 RepID=UPI000D01BD24|nr:MarR family transcriptional regulator [Microbacterium sp. str. 'China']AVL96199.1 MarR family transcriptional regulator [Microbacterium sp. str. 'China']